jgi:hypothetical protein
LIRYIRRAVDREVLTKNWSRCRKGYQNENNAEVGCATVRLPAARRPTSGFKLTRDGSIQVEHGKNWHHDLSPSPLKDRRLGAAREVVVSALTEAVRSMRASDFVRMVPDLPSEVFRKISRSSQDFLSLNELGFETGFLLDAVNPDLSQPPTIRRRPKATA